MISQKETKIVKDLIDQNHTFILTTHVNPDGDAVGSEITMANYLKFLGKNVFIINNSPTPKNYEFLDPQNEIIVYDEEKHFDLISSADIYMILDISDWERLRKIGEIIQQSNVPKICIDHHHINYQFADIDIIYEKASSTGELIYDFLKKVNFPLDGSSAQALYTCILTDTGSFRFSNTTEITHNMAAELIQTGVHAKEVYSEVYEQNSRTKMALMGEALCNLNFECDGQLAWFILTLDMFEKHHASHWDTEGFPEIPRTINGVEVSLMFTELSDDKVKVSLRSKGKIIIGQVAEKLGGGGHNFAAGALVRKNLAEIVPMVLEETKNLVESAS